MSLQLYCNHESLHPYCIIRSNDRTQRLFVFGKQNNPKASQCVWSSLLFVPPQPYPMPWFWGSKKEPLEEEEEEEEEAGSSEEYSSDEYSSSEEEEEDLAPDDSHSYDHSEEEEEEDQDSEEEDEQSQHSEEESSSASSSEVSEEQSSSNEESASSHASSQEEESPKSSLKPSSANGINPSSDLTNGIQKSVYAHEFEDDSSSSSSSSALDDDNATMERIEAGVPDHVVGNRPRAPSVLGMGGTDDNDDEESNTSLGGDESIHSETSNEQDHVTTLAEKQSLLVLAAEHDRVDILNTVLSEAADEETKHQLLHGGVPPLHIAVLHGSTNTATCLLRLGADPSLRPNVQEIGQKNQSPQTLDVPKQIDNLTAWEIAFVQRLTPAAKRDGVRNAFAAEALRCMGADDAGRLQHLLDAGMEAEAHIMGDRSLYEWAVELGAPQCQAALRPPETNSGGVAEEAPCTGNSQGRSAVLDRPSSEQKTAVQMTHQLEELESLAKALSTCLDNLAEEVSVSHGLLLMGGGGSALASHVRSLKTVKEQKFQELSRHQDSLEHTQDELEYWIKKAGPRGEAIAAEETPVPFNGGTRKLSPPPQFANVEEERAYCDDLQKRIEVTNDKIRKFRVSITDLSEENDRNMQEVEKRGLSGGINLVRGIKDEIREVDFALEELKVSEAVYRAKIDKIQSYLNDPDRNGAATKPDTDVAEASKASAELHTNGGASEEVSVELGEVEKPSERIATGQSTALVVRRDGPGPGSFPLSLWQIILRIIGIRDPTRPAPTRTSDRQSGPSTFSSQPVMIV